MEIQFILNGKMQTAVIAADTLLLDLLRSLGCYSVKRGCETSNCGLCTVWMNQKPVLFWLQGQTAVKLQLWRAFRRRRKKLGVSLQRRERISAAFAARD